ncbi:PGR5-like protein 1B, chloroplastic [Selaginella moellendorffii]|uniref:PGR5-like protein 1B, chloroplastic n=1 Tax=Selaginella moellendorffii TaxID=88036 RepID=UPI000D1C48B8|nr:PGR5-like protein 1B, chloroplastic [Selaginella moellendorffii]|eukprot:XP_024524487.1 PGR5-like protein 1B, chloroplastic [Selaginella moellendorffii]
MALCLKIGASSSTLQRAGLLHRSTQASSFVAHSHLRNGQSRSRNARIVMNASENQTVDQEELSDNKILPYCSIDKKKDKKSVGELEQEFLQALQSFYYDKKPMMTNEEFDNLKEELLWEGSNVVILSPDEQRFMEASLAYAAGKRLMSDEEYDRLKLKLKKSNSKVAIEGPRCSLRSKKVYSDCTVDYLKMTLLNLPAVLISLLVVFFLDDLTGFEITYLLELPEPYGFIFTWSVVLPATFFAARFITNLVFKDALILKGPCANCGSETNSYFGTILGVASGGSTNDVKCEQCKALLKFDSETRLITLEKLPGIKDNRKMAI